MMSALHASWLAFCGIGEATGRVVEISPLMATSAEELQRRLEQKGLDVRLGAVDALPEQILLDGSE